MKNEELKIPKHWEIKKLGEVCYIIMGQSPPSSTYNYDGKGIPFFQGKAEFTELYPVVEKWCSEPTKIAEPNDVLLSVRAPVGTTNIANQRCCIGRGLAAIRYRNYKYIFYFLRSIEQQLDNQGTGTTFRAISGETIRSTLIPLPPIHEQASIVAKIEELLSDLENGKQQLLIAKQQLKVYRQSLLKAAFEGRLTENEGMKELKNEKLESSDKENHNYQKNHSADNLPEGWKWVKLGDVIQKLEQGWSPKCLNEDSKDENEWAVIKTSAVQHGKFLPQENKILPLNLKPRIQHEIKKGDILITRAGPRIRVGVCCLVKKVRPKLINSDKIYRIRVLESIISPEYFERVLNSSVYINEIEKIKTGINDSGVNLTQNKFMILSIPLPPLPVQEQIVSILESKLTVCDKLEETINNSLEQAETLRQSILKKSFEGRLV